MTTDYGTDLSAVSGLDPSWPLVTGTRVVVEACVRRLTTQRGTLFYDLNYGTDLREALNAKMSASVLATWRSRIESELRKDERIDSVRAALTFVPDTETLTVQIDGIAGSGPFRFVLAVSAVTVALLTVG